MRRTIGLKTVFIIIIMFCFLFGVNAFAGETSMNVVGSSYELSDESAFITTWKSDSSMLCFGKKH